MNHSHIPGEASMHGIISSIAAGKLTLTRWMKFFDHRSGNKKDSKKPNGNFSLSFDATV
jgi:hypothetical protein